MSGSTLSPPSSAGSPPGRPDPWQRFLRQLVQPRGPVARWLRLGQAAIHFTRQAGLRAGARRALADLRHVLPIYAQAAWRHAGQRGDVYRQWQQRSEPGPAALAEQRIAQVALPYRPLISIVTAVRLPDAGMLSESLASLQAQTYDRWAFCLAVETPPGPANQELVAKVLAVDPRLRLQSIPPNAGSSASLNVALGLATGDFVLRLDPGDTLAPDLLYNLARRLNAYPDLDALYFDADQLAANGRARREPWFKPHHWSPAMLLSANLLRHSALRRQLVLDLGGYDPSMDGAHDWDLALRFTERSTRPDHLPQVGYHQRSLPALDGRDAIEAAQQRSLAAHLARRGTPAASVDHPVHGRVRIRWPVSGALVSIIIPTRDKLPLLQACLASIFRLTTYPRYEIVLVDTGSSEPATWANYAGLEAAGRPVRVLKATGAFNYAAANNLGARQAAGQILVFLNNDVEVLEPDWLEELAGWAEQPGIGLVGTKLLRPDGTVQHAGLVMGLVGHGSHLFDGCPEDSHGPFGSSAWYRDCLAVTGACLAVRRQVFDQLQGFDEAYQLGFSDIELGLRAVSHGLRVVYTPFARLRHHEGATRGFHNLPADVLRAYWQMLPLASQGDPYYSPHLSSAERRPTVARAHELTRMARLERILTDHELLYRPIPVDQPYASRLGSASQHFDVANTAPAAAGQILLVSHDLSLTGAPLMLVQAAEALCQAGFGVSVVAPLDGPLRETLNQAGVPVWVEPALLDDARVLARYLAGRSLVVANTILAWRVVLAAKAAQMPCLWWIHESNFGQAQAQRQSGLVSALAAADRVMFAADSVASRYAAHVPAERAVVVHNGLTLPDSFPAGAPTANRADTLTVVNLASLEPRKAQALLLKSAAALPAGLRQRTHVILLGHPLDRRYYARLRRLAARPGPVRVSLLGARPRAEALAYLRAADVFVLPSLDEAFPVTLLEAMALGKAIVATRVGGVMEAVHDEVEALLVPPDDPVALTAALRRLLQDSALRERLGRAAQARFEAAFTSQQFGAALVAPVRALIAARQAASEPGQLGAREGPGTLPVAYQLPAATDPAAPLLEAAPLIW